jgi:RNA polymerase sigma-70 factor (ECF subfamily)
MQEPSAELLNKAFAFDRKAQLELYTLCYPILISVARSYRKNDEDHLTLVNNAFIKIINYLDRYQEAKFFSWIKRIITNEIIDEYRRNKKYQSLFQQDAWVESTVGVTSVIEYEINDQFLHHILLELPEGTRAVFNLFAIDGYSHKEIGEMLGISEQTSKWHTKIARKKLKELLKLEMSNETR